MTIQNFKNNNVLLPLDIGIKYQYDISSVSSSNTPTGGATQHYICFITAVCMTLMVSMSALADDTTTETCADGSGTVVVGKISGNKYCKSNSKMTWWNAYAWCDGQGRKLFPLDECRCSGTINCKNICPELTVGYYNVFVWTGTPGDASCSYVAELNQGNYSYTGYSGVRSWANYYALCY